MKAVAPYCIFPMILESSQKHFTAFLLKLQALSLPVIFFFVPHPGFADSRMYFLQNDAKIKDLDLISQVQGASRGHLTASASLSLSQSVQGKAVLLGLPFLNQIASETFLA